MQIMNLFCKTMVSMAVILMFGDVNAAERTANSARMVMTHTYPMNSIGNTAVSVNSAPAAVSSSQSAAPIDYNPPVMPRPDPEPDPDTKPEPKPEPKPTPKPVKQCEDGGIKNSKYTVANCMDDLKRCINTGALQGGINDLFNEDVRNSVFTGMKLCQNNVDKCIVSVRVDCHNVYNSSNDVWLDFNSRVIQPEYYNFVLRKTGLSPNQAENTCLLLDRNAYGPSFASVSDLDMVKAEYYRSVGAYNGANGKSLSKENPLGVEINTLGYDGQRGHYARWDAAKAECYVRVGAYNKNTAIKNSWLFGAVGNDKMAEVWQPAGSTFTCNKDLFGFSLFNDTKTAAVVGIAGGAVVGAGVGAGIGAGMYDAKQREATEDKCKNAEYRRKLGAAIEEKHADDWLKNFLCEEMSKEEEAACNGNLGLKKCIKCNKTYFAPNDNFRNMTEKQCQAIHKLFSKKFAYEQRLELCKADEKAKNIVALFERKTVKTSEALSSVINKQVVAEECLIVECSGCTEPEKQQLNQYYTKCRFKPLMFSLDDVLCDSETGCLSHVQIQSELDSLTKTLALFESQVDGNVKKSGKGSSKGAMIGKGAAIGGAVGVGAGGLATAITAFVERSNINCKVGDGLNTVSFGKTYTIDTLREFYVKWNLQLPDSIAPTSVVTDVQSWEQACAQFNHKLYDCPNVQINYKKDGKYELISGACKIAGNMCIINDAVAISRGEEEDVVESITKPEKPRKIRRLELKAQHPEWYYDIDEEWYYGSVKSKPKVDLDLSFKDTRLDQELLPAATLEFHTEQGVTDTGTVPGDPFTQGQ